MSGRVTVAGHPGLTAAEAVQSRSEHGANVLTPPKRTPWWRQWLEKFDDPVIRILLVAAGVSLVAGALGGGHVVEAVGILVAVLLATTLAFLNEFKAAAEFALLNRANDEVPVKVVRDAGFTSVPRRDVVVGDLVLVELGDEVPADGRLIESVDLQIDESKLTGESVPAPKHLPDPDEADEGDHAYPPDRLLRSTLAADGHGAFVVEAVGDGTEIGHTARAAAEDTGTKTPLTKQLDRLSKLIGVLGFSVASVTFGALVGRALLTGELRPTTDGIWFLVAAGVGLVLAAKPVWGTIVDDARELLGRARPEPEKNGPAALQGLRVIGLGALVFALIMGVAVLVGGVSSSPSDWIALEDARRLISFFMIAVVIIVVAVPEGLAMSVTLSLAYSVRKMTAANNLVRRMHACETIGAATVICSDKTGTLTENRMRVRAVGLPDTDEPLQGEAAQAGPLVGTIYGSRLLNGIAVNSTANLEVSEDAEDGPKVLGNPTEGALLIWSAAAGVDYLALREGFQVERQWTFDRSRKYMATLGGERRTLHVKGAPEIVLERCDTELRSDGEQYPIEADREAIRAHLAHLQARGMRTLGLAYRDLEPGESVDDLPATASGLVWLGFFAIADPVRADVPEAVAQARRAGIDVKVVTGDTAETAREIARQCTLIDADSSGAVMECAEFEALSDEALKERLPDLRVLARARPADKMRLVQLLKEQGEVVAVTGDGTNDAPALNYADVGLAMGKTGTSVAKEAADIVLLDDSFPSIITAVKWGRSLYRNIQRFILFQLTINVAACIVAMLGPFIGVELPLTVIQMLWVNLIMDTFAALALATEPASDEVLLEPPRDPAAFIITRQMAISILGVGFAFVGLLVVLLKTSFLGGDDTNHELTLFFNVFVMLQFWNIFNARVMGTSRSAFSGLGESKPFLVIAGLIVIGQVLIVQFGGEMFRTTPLTLGEWGVTLALTAPVLVIGEVWRFTRRR